MDPNETLARIRELLAETFNEQADHYTLDELANLVDALDVWILKGGFLPAQWSTAQMRGPA